MSQFTLLREIEFTKYIRTYCKSNNVRAKYFEKGRKKLPLSVCNKTLWQEQGIRVPDGVKYEWCSFPVIRGKTKVVKDFLIDCQTGEKVIANQGKVGKPRYENINGQAILNGTIRTFEKNAMLNQIKDYFKPFLYKQEPFNLFPLVLRMQVHDFLTDDISKGQEWDLENRFIPYGKALHDLLCEDIKLPDGSIQPRLIPDDNVKYITGPMQPLFVPIQSENERKMVLQVYKDNRDVILNDLEYQFYLRNKLKNE